MSITITNPEGRNIEFKDQRGPTCGLYSLSFVLDYLYNIKIPATSDGDKKGESLRRKFKRDGKTIIGELYDSTPVMADYIRSLESSKIKCQSATCEVSSIVGILDAGGLCMVPFCVDAGGNPDTSGIRAHWCVIQKNVDCASRKLADAYHWGRKFVFDLNILRASNQSIQDVAASWWGKDKDSTGLDYYSCDSEESTTAVDAWWGTHQLKPGSVKQIPAALLSQTLAGKMLIFTK
ncbi:hypothetical protein [Akkermansia muciniphila]|uniref:hypothetical protein n=1 Tax=Akkermansia muciniphila TaxID=239935 RepID=UPI0027D34D3C|nr:hypothetical protein [Akkermansia muciniphila]WMB15090.1 hypothetical protein O4G22_10445 [Akkermansia muciniphila]WMB19660.1 hypothetical protein O4G19_11135 [Akkermansia muciniphila]